MTISTNELLAWLDNETTRNNQYHNHKENMAWVATALYTSGIVTVGLNLNHLQNTLAKILVTLGLFLITAIVCWFICWQFRNRDIARLKVKYLTETILGLLTTNFDKDWRLPSFILDRMAESERKIIKDVGGGTWLPRMSHWLAIAVAVIVFILAVWFSSFFR